MKNSPSKVVVARLTAGKLYRFLHRGGARRRDEETSTSGGGKDTYWDAPMFLVRPTYRYERMKSSWSASWNCLVFKDGALW